MPTELSRRFLNKYPNVKESPCAHACTTLFSFILCVCVCVMCVYVCVCMCVVCVCVCVCVCVNVRGRTVKFANSSR